MFDDYARSLFSDFPEFEGLLADSAARALSQAYLAVIEYRINGAVADLEGLAEVQPFLRRLANTLIFHVVLDDDREEAERQAASFVAAEAIALMADYLAVAADVGSDEAESAVRSAERFARTESSLLYLFARYDACAAGVLRPGAVSIPNEAPLIDLAAHWFFERMERLCRLNVYPPTTGGFLHAFASAESLDPYSLEEDTVARLYVRLGSAVSEFCRWLAGAEASLEAATAQIEELIETLSLDGVEDGSGLFGYEFSRIFHLGVLLKLCFPSLGSRALVRLQTTIDG